LGKVAKRGRELVSKGVVVGGLYEKAKNGKEDAL